MKLSKKNTFFTLTIVFLLILSKNSNIKYKLAEIASYVNLKTITRNMSAENIDNITFYYSNKKDEAHIDKIEEYVQEGEEKTKPIFGQTIMYPLNVIMFTTSEAFGKEFKVNPKERLAVTSFNSIYIPYDNINPYIFVHEYTHYKMNSFYKVKGIQKFKIPVWFEEGVSEYASSTLFPEKFENAKIEKVQDFKKLKTTNQMQQYNESYMQSYMAVRKIIALKGQDSIQQILINTKFMTFYDAFEKVVGLSIEDFQKLPLNDSVNALLKSGWAYNQQKKFDKAKDTFLEAAKKYPDSELAWLNLGNAYMELGDFDSAKEAMEKRISVANKKSLAYFNYSQLFISTDLDKAISMAEKASQLAKKEGSDNPKFVMDYFLLIKNIKYDINIDKPFTQYITLIKSNYIYSNMLKVHIINQILGKYPNENISQKEQLIKLKSNLENQK